MKILSKNYKKLILALVVVLVAGFGVKKLFLNDSAAKAGPTVEVNQAYTFKGRDAEGVRGDTDLTLNFLSAQKQSEVLIKGQRARARNEKVFLTLEFGLKNDSSQVLYLNPQDLVRWVEADESKIAPQVHQGSLEVRPQSTKRSNVGFVVPEDQKEFTIQVGELDGEKQTFTVNF